MKFDTLDLDKVPARLLPEILGVPVNIKRNAQTDTIIIRGEKHV